MVVAPAVTVWAAHRAERRTSAVRGEVLGRTLELLEAAPDLLAFNAAARYRTRLEEADRSLSTLLRRAAVARGLGGGIGVLAIGAMSAAATAAGIVAVRAGVLPGPALAVLALTPLALADVVAGLPDAAVRLLTALPAARRLAELETQPSPVTEPARPVVVDPPTGLATSGLAVRWPGADRDAVQGVDMSLRSGTRLAITGPSGSGKSSVVAALMRTLDPAAGAVLADGRDVRDLASDTVRDGIAWCGAATHLFDNTLRANLLLASPTATDDELVRALRQAQLGSWLATLPDGLDTAVGRTRRGGLRRRAPTDRRGPRAAGRPAGDHPGRTDRPPRRAHRRRPRRRAARHHAGSNGLDRDPSPGADARHTAAAVWAALRARPYPTAPTTSSRPQRDESQPRNGRLVDRGWEIRDRCRSACCSQ